MSTSIDNPSSECSDKQKSVGHHTNQSSLSSLSFASSAVCTGERNLKQKMDKDNENTSESTKSAANDNGEKQLSV